MRLSRKAKENMLMYQNLPKPAQTKEGLKRAADESRKARNLRKAAAKIPVVIIPLPTRAGNPKKNRAVRRERPQDYRQKGGVYIPFVLLNISGFRTKHYPGRKKQNPQMDINTRLIGRAHQARADGGYHHINPQADHGKNQKHAD